MSKKPKIAIIILNWNGLEDTKECTESVFKNDYPNYSIYLIDNDSENDDLGELKKWYKSHQNSLNRPKSVVFLQNTKNLGFAEGNNVGIRKALEAGAEYIFTLNNDTIVDPSFLSEALEAIEGPDKHIGIIATQMVNYYTRSKLDNTGHHLLTTGDTVPRGRNSNARNPKSSQPMGACAGAALYSSAMLKQIGLFDKEFFLNYEDADLSLRGIVQGWSCVYAPKSIIYHKINASIKKIKDSGYRIRSQRNQLWAYLHNTPLLVIILNLPWIFLRELLIFVISIITLRWTITWIFICSRFEVLKTLPRILSKRRKVMKHKKVSSLWFWRQQRSWFSTYWRYFKDIVIRRQESVME